MSSQSEPCAVLTAAGSGSRLGCECPKALVELSGRPLVWWAARGLRAGGVGPIVVTAPASSIEEFRRALAEIDDISVVSGSDRSRQESVALGLAALGERNAATIVLVHDAARPLTPSQVTARVIDAVRGGAGAVIPVLPVNDTLKTVSPSGAVTGTPRRSNMVAVQTPQGFRWEVLMRAHEAGASLGADEAAAATDDAGLVEAIGFAVQTVAGDERSLKVTRPLDLALAQLLVAEEMSASSASARSRGEGSDRLRAP